MTPETRERIRTLLSEALVLLDADQASIAAIHIAQALDALGHRPNDPPGFDSSPALQ